jgi:phosphohistidine phosphatase
MIVGHLPFLERVASLLLTGDENRRPVLFGYGAVVCLEKKDTGGWAVLWVLIPEMAA